MGTAANNKGTPANDAPPADGQQSAPNGDGQPPANNTRDQGQAPNAQGNENDQATRRDAKSQNTLARDPDLYFTHGTDIYGKDMGAGKSVEDLDRISPPTESTPGLVGQKEARAKAQREADAHKSATADSE